MMKYDIFKLNPKRHFMNKLGKTAFVLFTILILSNLVEAKQPVNVTLQLKWKHQFQFAGYYAAIEKGFFKDVGIQVTLIEAVEGQNPSENVFKGKAEFGVCASDILLMRSQNKPAVVLTTVFQHSPQILLASMKSDIQHIQNLVGKRIAMEPNAADIIAFMKDEGVPPDKCIIDNHTFDVNKLLKGEIDAISAYSTDEPYLLKEANFDFTIISPSMGGIDFYGDVLFTTETFIKKNPVLVDNFRKASLKGWKYAMDNPDEIVELIYGNYSKRHTKEHLKFEAFQMKNLVMADVVEIGYTNRGRWNSISDIYKKLNMIGPSFMTDGLLYSDYLKPKLIFQWKLIEIFLLIVFIVGLIGWFFYKTTVRLKKEIKHRMITETELHESELKYKDMADLLPQIVFETDVQGNLTYVNKQAFKILGYPEDYPILGVNTLNFYTPESKERAIENIQLRASGKSMNNSNEYTLVRKDGSTFQALVYSNPILKDGKPIGLRGIIVDITERRQAEVKLLENEHRYRVLIETAIEGILVAQGATLKFVNPMISELTGYSEEELLSIPFLEFVHPENKELIITNQRKRLSGETVDQRYHIQVIRKDRSIKWVEMSGVKIEWEGQPAIMNFVTDITQRKVMEDALKESESRFRHLVWDMQVGVLLQGPKSEIMMSNPKALELLDLSEDQLLGKTSFDPGWNVIHEDGSPFPGNTHPVPQSIALRNPVRDVVMGVYRPTVGDIVWLLVDAEPQFLVDGSIRHVVCSFIDITSRKLAEAALKESEELHRSILNASPDDITITDLNSNILMVSQKAVTMFGYSLEEELLGHEIIDFMIPEDRDLVSSHLKLMLGGIMLGSNEYHGLRKDGSTFDLEMNSEFIRDKEGKPSKIVFIIRDITRRKQAEEEIQKWTNIFINAKWGVAALSGEGTGFELMNPAFAEMHGFAVEDLITKSLVEVFAPEVRSDLSKEFDIVRETGHNIFESLHIRNDNSVFPVLVDVTAITDETGKISYLAVNVQDITERKISEEKFAATGKKIQQSEENLKKAQAVAHLGNWEWNLNSGEVTWSDEMYLIFGIDKNSYTGRLGDVIAKVIHPDDLHLVLPSNAGDFAEKKPIEYRIIWPDNSIRHIVAEAGLSIFDSDGNPAFLTGVAQDITERKREEKAMRKSEEMLREAGHLAKLGGWELDISTMKLTWTEETYRIHEVDPLIQPQLDDGINFYLPEAQPILKEAIGRTMTEGLPFDLELPFITAKGKHLWVRAIGNADRIDGVTVRIYGIFQDITDRKKSEEALKANEEKYRMLFNSNKDSISIVGINSDGTPSDFIEFNDAACETFGYTREELMSLKLKDLEYEVPEVIMKHRIETLQAEGRVDFETVIKDKAGKDRILEVKVVLINYESRPALMNISRDITERKKAEELLRETNAYLESATINANEMAAQAETANKAKSIFLANMSHEIRTPLNAILGFSQLMSRDKHLSDIQKEYNVSIIRAGEHLLTLINDILELSKVEAGRVVLNLTTVDLHTLFNDLQMIFKERAQSKHLQFIFETAENLPRYVVTDESKLRQIFINLIGNAVKFTEQGGIAVRSSVDIMNEDTLQLIVEIQDSGPGIPDHELRNLFKHFVQTSTGIKKGSGTGLGLALSRELARLMGGNITVSSEVGKGSLFTFYIEIKEGKADPVAANTSKRVICIDKDQKAFRILVVDDKKENLQVVVDLLKLAGFETNEAVNGEDAIAKFEEWNPDLILMDLRMPVMDGYEATRRIKLTEKGAKTPIIALTASTFDGERRKILSMGIQGYIRKPFREHELFSILGKELGIRYNYEIETPLSSVKYLNDDEVIAQDIAKLPYSQALLMLDAIAVADINKLKELIHSIEHDNLELAQYFMSLAKNYDYEHLQKILNIKGIEDVT